MQSQTGEQKRSSDQPTPTSSGSHKEVSEDLLGQKGVTEHLGKLCSAVSPMVGHSHLEINSGKCVSKTKVENGT